MSPIALGPDHLERRYDTGNRAPPGIFLPAGWLQTHGAALKSWILKSILAKYSDVPFVTNYTKLIEWMRNPVPKSQCRNRAVKAK
jgi:hypothetical protein